VLRRFVVRRFVVRLVVFLLPGGEVNLPVQVLIHRYPRPATLMRRFPHVVLFRRAFLRFAAIS